MKIEFLGTHIRTMIIGAALCVAGCDSEDIDTRSAEDEAADTGHECERPGHHGPKKPGHKPPGKHHGKHHGGKHHGKHHGDHPAPPCDEPQGEPPPHPDGEPCDPGDMPDAPSSTGDSTTGDSTTGDSTTGASTSGDSTTGDVSTGTTTGAEPIPG